MYCVWIRFQDCGLDSPQFRIEKDYMKLRVEDLDNKDRDYVLVSMTPRMEAQTADDRK